MRADERPQQFRRANLDALIATDQAAAQEAAARARAAWQELEAATADYGRAVVAIAGHVHATPGGHGARADRDERVEQWRRTAQGILHTEIQAPRVPQVLDRVRSDG